MAQKQASLYFYLDGESYDDQYKSQDCGQFSSISDLEFFKAL